MGIKHLAFVAGSCYKEQERRFNYVPWHGRGNEQQLSADAKARKSFSNHQCPGLHTGDLIDHNSVIPERKGKMRA